ncbi:MAG TPA: TIR domain-containing protein [Chthoniobacterales bacterium]|nr:TIR domain-containing protein [Chthoniobacterales bacterium]
MAGRVFISHSEKDKTFAEMLLKALEDLGTNCWIAPRDIPPGGSYADAIMRSIQECSCFVLVYTMNSNSSPHVLREVERALKFERNIVPVRFDQSEPSRSLDYLLATVQWLSAETATAEAAVSRIAEQISACVAPPEAITPAAPRQIPAAAIPPPSTKGRPGTSKFLILGLLVVAAILLTWFVSQKFANAPAPRSTSLPSPATPAPKPTAALSVSPESVAQSATAPLLSVAPTAVATKTIQQSAPEQTDAATPEGILRRYFGCFAERDPVAAYNLLSTGFRSEMSFKKYSAMFSSTREIQVDQMNVTNDGENKATVSVRFRETDADYHQAYWQGPIELVRDKGEWRIKTLRELKKIAAPEGGLTQPKLNVATGEPSRPPEKTWDKPHVYLQLANESQRSAAADLKRRLTQLGCDVVEIQSVSGNVDVPTESSEIRYFSTRDAAEAQRLANEVQSFFRSTGVIAYLPEGMPYVSHARQYEIWFSSAFH